MTALMACAGYVAGRALEMYCSHTGIPSNGHITPTAMGLKGSYKGNEY